MIARNFAESGRRLIRLLTYIYVGTRWGRLDGDSGGAVKLGPGLSFSWKRALGVTKAKRRVSKKTGIPLSRGGRRMKLGKWLGMK